MYRILKHSKQERCTALELSMKKLIILFITGSLITLMTLLYFAVFWGELNYMKERNYNYNFQKGDYLFNEEEFNISLSCKAASPYYFRIAFGEKKEFYTNYYDNVIATDLDAYFILNKDTIFPKVRLHSGSGLLSSDIKSIKPIGTKILTDNYQSLSWIEIDVPDSLRKGNFKFILDLKAKDLKTDNTIKILKTFDIECGTKYGYRGLPFMP